MDTDSVDLSLLRAAVLDASPEQITQDRMALSPRSQRRHRVSSPPAHRQPPPPPPPPPPQPQPPPPTRRRSPGRMPSGETQRSDRTDPLSQWAYELTPGQSRSHVTGTNGDRTAPASTTYHTGDVGHVALELAVGSERDRLAAGLETQEAEDLHDLPVDEDESLTELFPPSQRFQPKTPASAARKRKREAEDGQLWTTPGLPANPFGSSATRGAGPMRMSQVFRATQAPSSPFAPNRPSDPPSSRPSPAMDHAERPATAQATSSPARLPQRHRRAVTAPHTSWKSQHGDDQLRQASSPSAAVLDKDSASEDDLGMPSSPGHGRRIRQEKARAARELRGASGRWPAESPPTRRVTRTHRENGHAARTQSHLRTATAQEDLSRLTESEDETEREEEEPSAPIVAQDEDEDLSENKENVAQPPKSSPPITRRTRGGAAEQIRVRAQSDRKIRHADIDPDSDGEIIEPGDTDLRDGWRNSLSQVNNDRTIADSQRSPRMKDGLSHSNWPRSTDDSSKVVCESQAVRATASSPTAALQAGQGLPISSSEAVQLSPPKMHSLGDPGKVNETNNPSLALTSEPMETLANELVTSSNTQSRLELETPYRNMAQVVTIPETTVASRRLQGPHSASQPAQLRSIFRTHSKPSLHTTQETGAFHSARSPPKPATQQTGDASTLDSTQPSTGPAASQPMALMDVFKSAQPVSQEESISLSPEILKTNDPLYDEMMAEQSSPISTLRKRRARGAARRSHPPETGLQAGANGQAKADAEDENEQADKSRADVATTRRRTRTRTKSPVPSDEQAIPKAGRLASRSVNAGAATAKVPSEDEQGEQPSSPTEPPPQTRKAPQMRSRARLRLSADVAGPSIPDEEPATSWTKDHATQPLRLFAYFSSARPGFYPATCLAIGPVEPKFKVHFDDGNITQLSSAKVKLMTLRAGDSVRIDRKGLRNISYVVQRCETPRTDATEGWPVDNDGHTSVVVRRPVAPGSAAPAADETFPVGAVYLTAQSWKSFRHEICPQDLAAFAGQSGVHTPHDPQPSPPTPNSRLRTARSAAKDANAAALSARPDIRAGLFADFHFVLTNIDPPALRAEVTTQIHADGGSILHDGFEALFAAPANTDDTDDNDHDNDRAATRPTSSPQPPAPLQPLPHARNRAVILLATRHCRHPKYLQALALGVPCLSHRWIEHSQAARALQPWPRYLLAAGTSALLDGAPLSQALALGAALPAPRPCLADCLARQPRLLAPHRVLLVRLDASGGSGSGSGGGAARRAADQLDALRFLLRALGAVAVGRAAGPSAAATALAADSRWTLVVASASDVIDTAASAAAVPSLREPAPPSSSAATADRPAKRRKGAGRGRGSSAADALPDAGVVAAALARLVAPYAGVRGVSTEFVIQSLILGRLL